MSALAPPVKFSAGSNFRSSALNCPCGKRTEEILSDCAFLFSTVQPMLQSSVVGWRCAYTCRNAIAGAIVSASTAYGLSRPSARSSCCANLRVLSLTTRSKVNLPSIKPLRLSSSSMN